MGQTSGKYRGETDLSSALDFNPKKPVDESHEVKSESFEKCSLRHVIDDGGDGFVPVDLDVSAKRSTVPTIFRWEYGGKEVYVSGTFNKWKTRFPLTYSGGEHAAIIDLPSGEHHYKFLVDGNWVHDPHQKTVDDELGGHSNVIYVNESDFDPTQALLNDECGTNVPLGASSSSLSRMSPPGNYGQFIPDISQISQEPWAKTANLIPPLLPPHLLDVILNNDVVDEDDPVVLPIPNHVALNHLYALSIKDNVMTLSTTHRYKKKYITTVMYKPINVH
ncbi:5'-AMP-activated protein kinase subunit beta-2 isoform X1 [Hydra vulgaris]|uniref:5'-AMP-activated protein kinase subunit beta-1 n=1 Tax=Hydra vulgaris TaxID=6087 RepID=T2MJ27_HYDVU|nr:5'-AMP-activated protein kinase subunit beta-2 [Hydra vulgaris]